MDKFGVDPMQEIMQELNREYAKKRVDKVKANLVHTLRFYSK